MASAREEAVARDTAARARLAADPVYVIKQQRDSGREQPIYSAKHDDPTPTPSPRELAVLKLAANGFTNAEIAAHLDVGIETVKTQIRSCMGRLKARDRTHAAVTAVRRGLI